MPSLAAEAIMFGEELNILLTFLWSCVYLMCLTEWPALLTFPFLDASNKKALILSKLVSTNSFLFLVLLYSKVLYSLFMALSVVVFHSGES